VVSLVKNGNKMSCHAAKCLAVISLLVLLEYCMAYVLPFHPNAFFDGKFTVVAIAKTHTTS